MLCLFNMYTFPLAREEYRSDFESRSDSAWFVVPSYVSKRG